MRIDAEELIAVYEANLDEIELNLMMAGVGHVTPEQVTTLIQVAFIDPLKKAVQEEVQDGVDPPAA